MNRPLPRSLPPALLALTAVASIATSQPLWDVSASVPLDPLTWDDGAHGVSLAVETTGDVRRADLTDLSLSLDLSNPDDDSALLTLYQLPAPWDGVLPDDAERLGSVMVRGALDGEPGVESAVLFAGIDVPAELHLALLTDGVEPTGRATLTLSAVFHEAPEGDVHLEVIQ